MHKESPFFLPYPHPTIVDMQYVSHVERAVASAMPPGSDLTNQGRAFGKHKFLWFARVTKLRRPGQRYYKGYDVRKKFKNIDKWLSAYEKLPHYLATKSDYYTH